MAAGWSALALALQALSAAVLAIVLAASTALTAPAIGALVLVELGVLALLLAAAPLALAGREAPGSIPRPAGHLLRALCVDALALEIELVRMALEPCRSLRKPLPPPVPPRPVLLVHGFACSRAVWRRLLGRLRAAGVGPVRAVNLEPLLADIEAHAAAVLGELEVLAARGRGNAITIVGHSMGGLVARAALRRARPGLIGRIITLGAPHHGTALACRFRWASTRQMCPGSSWLAELNERQEGRLPVPVTSLYSVDDNYIVPAVSARLEGARTIELRGLGHLALLESTGVLDQVMAELLG